MKLIRGVLTVALTKLGGIILLAARIAQIEVNWPLIRR